MAITLSFSVNAETFTVTNTNGSGEGSFQDAVNKVNAKIGGYNIDFVIDFSLDTIGDVVIDLPGSLDFLSEDKVLKGYLVIDGSSYKNGKITILINRRIQFYGQRITFNNIDFVGKNGNLSTAHSPSFLCNRMGSVVFNKCSFSNFNNSNMIEDALFANTEYRNPDYYPSRITCNDCVFDNCNLFKHSYYGASNEIHEDSPFRCFMTLIFNGCTLKNSKAHIYRERYISINSCSFTNTPLSVNTSERFESRENFFYTASSNGKGYTYDENLAKPEFLSVVSNRKSHVVKGVVRDAQIKNNELVEDAPISVDIYYTSNGKGTTTLFLGNAECDANGEFEFEIPLEQLDKDQKLTLSACAVYDLQNGPDVTSELSFFCIPDTSYVKDTINIGTKLRGVTYNEIGIFKDEEIVEASDGCDSVIVHSVIVKPNIINNNVYVKIKREGKGDGSSWKDAMSGEDFAAWLPLAPDGTTFHVAKGEYTPKYGRGLEETNDPNKLCYEINSKVIIIGGYSSYASNESEQSKPDRYQTIFNGDIKHDNTEYYEGAYVGGLSFKNNEDNIKNMFVLNDNFSLRGVIIKGCYVSKSDNIIGTISMNKENIKLNVHSVEFVGNTQCINGSNKSEIVVDSCRFIKNVGCGSYAGAITNSQNGSLKVKNSYFNQCNTCNYGGAINSQTFGIVDVENCTFEKCWSYSGSAIYLRENNKFNLVNSTFVNNNGTTVIDLASPSYHNECKFYNNTIFSNNISGNAINVPSGQIGKSFVLEGNVIESISVSYDFSEFISRNNIVMCDLTERGNGFLSAEETNVISMSPFDISKCFEGTYDSENEKFIATLSEDEEKYGFTPTVAVKSDKLGDKSIRFPRLKDVLTDQRGVARPKSTCIGAYEPECKDVEYSAVDSVFVGEEKYGVTFDKLGIYEGISYKYISSTGCDSVVNYKIFARPKSSIKTYYVKTNGDGDGSDWDHALSQADFDYILKTLSTDDVTFYLAGGTYHARYDRDFNYFENSSKNCTWTTYRPVTIIGGFDPESKGKVTSSVVPDVKKFPTVLSGDVDENDELVEDGCSYTINNQSDNVRTHLFTIDLSNNPGTINLSNLVFTGTYNTSGYAYGFIVYSTHETRDKVNANVSQCEFSKNYFGLSGNQVSNMTVDGCEFNYIKDLGLATSDYCKVTNSTFKHCYRAISSYDAKSCNVVNSTFVNNLQDFDCNAEITEFYNNTFVSCTESYLNSLIYSDNSNYFYGNIFAGSRLSLNNNGSDGGKLDIANNVIAADFGTITLGKGNIKVDPNTLFDGILDVVYSQKNGIEGINLSTKNGSTPVVALLKDELPTGEKIRFDRLDGVTKDQCGVERLDSTCMGACELGCTPITTFATDTIEIGTKFKDGKVYNEFGRHDNVLVTEIVDDCENTTNYTLYVMPKLTSDLNYYVKMEKKGKGDGSDWDNAMDGKDFAACLPLAPNGATFHVAAGEYKPEYDNNLEETKYYSSRQYTINKDVTIIGGYPSGATGKDVPSNPKMYITTFNGLFKSDDKEYTVSNLFKSNILEDLTLTIDGAVLKNAYSAVSAYNDLRVPNAAFDANFMNVSFENNSSYAIYSSADKGSIKLDHSSFKNNSSCIYSLHSNVDVRNSSFEKNGSDYLITIMNDSDTEGNKCGLNIDSSSFVGNTGYIQVYNDLFIKNSVFDSNETSGNFISAWSTSKFPDYSIGFSNNSFVNNKFGSDILESYSNTLATIENCQFTDNECGHDMIKTNYLTVYKSNLLRNNVKDVMFNCNYKTSFVSDTIADCTASDIVKYSVYGSHIDSCLIKNNDAYLLSYVQNTEGVRVKYDLNNSEIIGNTKTGNIDPTKYIINIHCGQSKNDSVNIIKSIFKNNKYNDCVFIFNYGSYFTFDQCLVESNEVRDFIHSDWAQSDISNSTFVDNDVDLLLYCNLNGGSYSKGTGATYKNNTIVRNNCNSLFDGYHSTSTYKNNTIVGNTCENYLFRYFHSSSLVGNILFGNVYGEMSLGSILIDDNFVSNIMPSHKVNDGILVDGYSEYHLTLLKGNILSDQYYKELSEDESLINDVDPKEINHLSDVASLFEGTYNSKTGLFTPVLEDNGGFTPTVALKKDALSDGTSIRFPRLEDVLTDQRGIERFDMTCMGSYETRCGVDTTFVNDTIVVGTEYKDGNIYEVGRHDSIIKVYTNRYDCDSIVCYTLYVMPDPSVLNYYVKTERVGKGDGSDWDNAMDGKDFASCLPLAPKGATFHVAAGTYKPIYGVNLSTPTSTSKLCYELVSDVTIKGGYRADAEKGDAPNPSEYHTIFDGDIKGNDVVEISTNDDGKINIFNDYIEDNASDLFYISSINSNILFDGVVISNSINSISAFSSNESNLTFESVTFDRNKDFAILSYAKKGNIRIAHSSFMHNIGCVYSEQSNINITSSYFEENGDNFWVV